MIPYDKWSYERIRGICVIQIDVYCTLYSLLYFIVFLSADSNIIIMDLLQTEDPKILAGIRVW